MKAISCKGFSDLSRYFPTGLLNTSLCDLGYKRSLSDVVGLLSAIACS
ncbi:hypothetical protein HCU40_12390 [Pseudanabaena biceps]|nr:hypothetical protein [Pseudanabaena biceps]